MTESEINPTDRIFIESAVDIPSDPGDFMSRIIYALETGNIRGGMTQAKMFRLGNEIGHQLVEDVKNGFPIPETHSNPGSPEEIDWKWLSEIYDQTREAFTHCLNKLPIPVDAKQFLKGCIDNTELKYTEGKNHYAEISGENKSVFVNPFYLWNFPRIAMNIFNLEDGLNKFFIGHDISIFGHELGHIVNLSLMSTPDDGLKAWPTHIGVNFKDGYPNWFPESKPDVLPYNPAVETNILTVNERFADYFSRSVSDGLGIPKTIWNDIVRIEISNPYISKLKFNQLVAVSNGIINGISEAGLNEDKNMIDMLYESATSYQQSRILQNPGMMMTYPLPPRTVEEIIKYGWTNLTNSNQETK